MICVENKKLSWLIAASLVSCFLVGTSSALAQGLAIHSPRLGDPNYYKRLQRIDQSASPACQCTLKDTDHMGKSDHLLSATAWFQSSGEFKALSYQAFNIARLRLDQDKNESSSKPKAIITDIDETVLDNGPYQAQVIVDQTGYPTGWNEWVNLARAEPLPGALEFFQHADRQGYKIIYVTNRKTNEIEPTYRNLKALGFPIDSPTMILARSTDSNKQSRINTVLENHKVVMLIGDNLGDFSGAFNQGQSVEERNKLVYQERAKFGSQWIALPNPMYGDWESAIMEHNWQRSAAEQRDQRIKHLKTFR